MLYGFMIGEPMSWILGHNKDYEKTRDGIWQPEIVVILDRKRRCELKRFHQSLCRSGFQLKPQLRIVPDRIQPISDSYLQHELKNQSATNPLDYYARLLTILP
jgi:hypothetical protein